MLLLHAPDGPEAGGAQRHSVVLGFVQLDPPDGGRVCRMGQAEGGGMSGYHNPASLVQAIWISVGRAEQDSGHLPLLRHKRRAGAGRQAGRQAGRPARRTHRCAG